MKVSNNLVEYSTLAKGPFRSRPRLKKMLRLRDCEPQASTRRGIRPAKMAKLSS